MRRSFRYATPSLLAAGLLAWSIAGPAQADADPDARGPVPQAAAETGPVAITTRVRPDPSHVGDLLELEVAAAYPRDVRVNLPSVLDLSPLHLVGVHEAEPEATGEGLRKIFTITLQHFEVGDATVPAFSLTYVTGDGQVHSVDVPPTPFVVDSLLANENDPQRKLEDPPISLEYPNELAEIVVYSILGTLLFGLLAWLLGRRLWGREKLVPAPPPIPPHELALRALQELESGELVEKGRFADYYLQLTEIAKGYLEGRFGVEALDRTTEEIRVELLRDPERLDPLSVDEVVRFLQACDLVKFARFRPDAEEATAALGWVREMVERTTQVPRARRDETSESPRRDAEATEATDAEPEGPEERDIDREARP